MDEQSELTVAMFFFIALTVLGICLGGAVVEDFACARASSSWRVVDGVVLSGARETAPLRYAYVLDGQSHESRRVRFRTAGFGPGVLDGAEPGDAVKVRVQPDNGAVAVLQPGGSGSVFAVYATIAGLFVFLGLGGLIRTLTRSGEHGSAFPEPGSLHPS